MKKLKNYFLVAVLATLTTFAFAQGDSIGTTGPNTEVVAGDTGVGDTGVGNPTTTTPTSPALPSITKDFTGLTLPVLAWIGIGFFGYFITRFRIAFAGTTTPFNLGIWFQRNYMNVAYIIIALVCIHVFKIPLSPLEGIALGASPNLLIDWIQREIKATGLPNLG
jgi:hypothetical protein